MWKTDLYNIVWYLHNVTMENFVFNRTEKNIMKIRLFNKVFYVCNVWPNVTRNSGKIDYLLPGELHR